MILALLAVLGCILITGAYQYNNTAIFNAKGIFYGFLCACAFAGYNIVGGRKGKLGLSTSVTSFYTFMVSALVWFPFYFTFDYSALNHIDTVMGVLFIGLFATLIPYWLYLEGLKTVEPYDATVLGLFDPLVAAISAYFMLNETLAIPQIIGVFVLLFVILYLDKNENMAQNQ